MSEEKWMEVTCLEGYLEVSSNGRLRSIKRAHPMGGFRGGIILKLSLSIHGYLFARVSHGSRKTNVYVHKAVANAFLNNNSELPQINHIDGVKANNHYKNLEWCTASHNSLHKFSILGCQAKNKKSVIAFCADRELYFDSLTSAGSAGFNIHNISAVLHGRRNTCGGYQWRLA